jgi:N-acetylmuramoyl-L-alanine amidase
VLSREFNEISVDHEILKAIRLEQTTRRAEDQGQNLVTVAMDLSRIVAFDVRQDEAPSRLVIGLELPKHAAGVLAGKTVVIDPGHGGSDVGAKGCNGSVEKEVNLQIASRLHKLLVERGVCALVTRKSDTDVALSKRVPYAVQHSADFFISVHSNWCNPVASGVETFHHDSGRSGRALAYCVHSEIMAVTDLPDRKVKSDYVRFPNMGMKVLRDAAASGIPAILIEAGFINHPVDYGRITDPDYQQKMAQAIFRGLKAYVEGNPNDPEPVRPSRSPADLGGVEEPEPKTGEAPPAGVRSAPEQVESPPSAAPEPLDSTSGPKRPGEK